MVSVLLFLTFRVSRALISIIGFLGRKKKRFNNNNTSYTNIKMSPPMIGSNRTFGANSRAAIDSVCAYFSFLKYKK